LIVNPASRRGARLSAVAERAIIEAGMGCDVRRTERPGHAAELATECGEAYDVIFTLGGDGTAMEVVGALAGRAGPPVGVLPGGTGNLLARALGIALSVPRAVQQLVSGDVAHIDLGRLPDGRRFAIGVGVGIDATMIAETPSIWKRRIGVAAYVLVAARAVLRADRFLVRVTADGTTVTRNASAVLVINFGALLNNLITLGDGIKHDDGVLNVCIFDPENLSDAIRIMWRLLGRDFAPDPAITYLSGREFRVETTPPRVAQSDGEIIGMTPFSVVTEPGSGCILVPHRQIRRQ